MEERLIEISRLCEDSEAGIIVPEMAPYITRLPSPLYSTSLSQVSLFDEDDDCIGICYSYGHINTNGIVIGCFNRTSKVLTLGCHDFLSESIHVHYTPTSIEEFFRNLAEAAHASAVQRRIQTQRYGRGLGFG